MTRSTPNIRPADSRLKECPQCQGRGEIWAPKKKICDQCKGKGFVARLNNPTTTESFVVKVQLSMFSSNGPQVLVYNEDKSVFWQDNADETILKTMQGRPKAFFMATRSKEGVIGLDQEVQDPGW